MYSFLQVCFVDDIFSSQWYEKPRLLFSNAVRELRKHLEFRIQQQQQQQQAAQRPNTDYGKYNNNYSTVEIVSRDTLVKMIATRHDELLNKSLVIKLGLITSNVFPST